MTPHLKRAALATGCVARLCALAPAAEPDWRSQGILYLEDSPHAKLRSVPVRAVKLGEGFWSRRMQVTVERSIPTLLPLMEEKGVVDNFRCLSGRKDDPRRGALFTDSDLYKWMEAVAFVLQREDRPELRSTLDRIIDEVVAAQEPSGYLNTYYVDERRPLRFAQMQSGHELYCLGHMLQAGIEKTDYPWSDTVEITVAPAAAADFTLHLRIPGWAPSAAVAVNGSAWQGAAQPGSYLPLRRRWRPGDKVAVKFDLRPRLIQAHPYSRDNHGRAALERGPLVYCLAQIDQEGVTSLAEVSLALGPEPWNRFQSEDRPDLLDGIRTLRHKGAVCPNSPIEEPLYRALAATPARPVRQAELVFVPYYTYGNRGRSPLLVWVKYTWN
ncbi:MAG: hypothetical protein FJ280_00710 [Planctomycetes bacterium]|nr:hypothetical protein [Planctomycetota bacterium]